MSITIENSRICASFYGRFLIDGGSSRYTVSFDGDEWSARCTCPAYTFGAAEHKSCKHIRRVMHAGCFWDEQSGTGGGADREITMRPDFVAAPNEGSGRCPGCDGPTVVVAVAA